ncbi:MAG: hypothetical protein RIC95_10430 [Vicingaceae bacterium]
MKEEHQYLLDAFLQQNLREGEEARLKELCSADSNFKKELEEAELILKGMKRKAIKKRIQKSRKGGVKGRTSKIIAIGLLSLAVLILLSRYLLQEERTEKKVPTEQAAPTIDITTQGSPTIPKETKHKTLIDTISKVFRRKTSEQITSKKVEVVDSLSREKSIPFKPKKIRTQQFSIHQFSQQSIVGEQGTKVQFPAGAFATKSDSIRIELEEYYDLKDMLFADLSTQTIDGSILQSGGMIKVEAFDRTGRKLQLKEGKSVGINFSSSEQQNSEMKIYYGNDSEETIEWEQKATSKKDSLRKEISVRPLFHGGIYYKDVDKQPIYSTTKKLETTLNENMRYQKQWRNKNDIEAKILYSVGEFGFVQGAYIIGESPTWADSLVQKLFMSLPRFEEAGVHKGEKRAVRMVLTMALNPQQEKQYYSSNEWNEFYDLKIKRRNAEQKQAGVKERRRFLDQSRASFQEGSGAMEKYRRNSERLGWINLDSPCYRETEVIALKLPDSLLDYKVRLVEPNRKVILAPVRSSKKAEFKKVPEGIEMFLFVQKGEGVNRSYAWQKWKIDRQFPEIRFQNKPDFSGTID